MVILLAVIAVLGASGPAISSPNPCCVRTPSIGVAVESPETSHRIGHVVSPAVMTAAFYGSALYFGADRKKARIISVVLSLAAIVGKELYDYSSEARAFSTLDVVLGLGGTAVGVVAAEAIEWPEERRDR